jgi:hypothetical protein
MANELMPDLAEAKCISEETVNRATEDASIGKPGF